MLFWLRKTCQYKPAAVVRIVWYVQYKLNQADGSYQGFDQSDLTELDDVTVGIADWKHYRKPIVISGIQKEVLNTGNKIFDLLEQKEKNALASMQEELNKHVYLDRTGSNTTRVPGMAALIAQTPTTGTIFGFDRATNTWAQNQVVDQATIAAFTGTPRIEPMRRGMIRLYQLCGRGHAGGGQRFPDLGLCTEDYLNTYNDMLSNGQRFTNTMAAHAGLTNAKFNGLTDIADQHAHAEADQYAGEHSPQHSDADTHADVGGAANRHRPDADEAAARSQG